MVDWCFIPSGPGAGGGGGWRKKYKNNGNLSGFHRVALPSTVFRSNRNLEMLVFVEEGKLENPEENP